MYVFLGGKYHMESNTFYDIYLEELKNLPQGTPEEEMALL